MNNIQSTADNLDAASQDLEKYISPYFWRNLDKETVLEGILVALLIFLVGHIIIRIISKIVRHLLRKNNITNSGIYYIEKALQFVLYFLLLIIIFNALGISSGTLFAIMISLAVALVLALRGSLTDLASGILILVSRPLREGDRVFLEDIDDYLTVKEIKFFNSLLIDRNNRYVIVPNERIMQKAVVNLSKTPFVYTDVIVSVSYDSDLKLVRSVIEDTLNNLDGIIAGKEYLIGVNNFGASGIDYLVSVPVMDKDYIIKQLEIREALKIAFDKNNIEIPYTKIEVKNID